MTNDPIAQGLQYLASEFSLTRQEWRNYNGGGDDLLDALVTHRYAQEQGERFGITQMGRARLEAE
ncbi:MULTISPECIES: hypothetical protein [unclassified Stenotrophomonas]|uniref:hypothetical protein n=1 Tax=unclassified Stenotrophomonas TaxID=196198 RepID=UPI003012F661